MSTTDDLTQAARDLLSLTARHRDAHGALLSSQQGKGEAGDPQTIAIETGAVDALDSLLDSEAAQRLELALERLKWIR